MKSNKDLLFNIGNNIQCLIIAYNGKIIIIYTHINPDHFAVNLKVTQYCKWTILKFLKLNVLIIHTLTK